MKLGVGGVGTPDVAGHLQGTEEAGRCGRPVGVFCVSLRDWTPSGADFCIT